jgi:uncharacterized protein YecT (DUF1311 family)
VFRRSALAVALLYWLPGSGARAFDCNTAATATEKAICAVFVDAALDAAFSAATAGASRSERDEIAAAQFRWLQTRDRSCTETQGAALGACLAKESEQRRLFLAGEPEAGAYCAKFPFRERRQGSGCAGCRALEIRRSRHRRRARLSTPPSRS